MALRAAVLRHFRLPVRALNPSEPYLKHHSWLGGVSLRLFSSHGGDHLSKDEVIERVISVVQSFPKVDPSKVTPEVHFQNDLGLDSLDNVEIVMALEEEFKLEIPDKEADKIDSCNLAIDVVAGDFRNVKEQKDGPKRKNTGKKELSPDLISRISKLLSRKLTGPFRSRMESACAHPYNMI